MDKFKDFSMDKLTDRSLEVCVEHLNNFYWDIYPSPPGLCVVKVG